MSASPPSSDRLLVAIHEGTAYVQVYGRGTFKISTALKQFGLAAVGCGCRRVILNMSHCIGMDSTFMGVLAGLAVRMKECGAERIALVNLSEKTRGLLATLGLDQVLQTCLSGQTPAELEPWVGRVPDMEALERVEESRQATAETMLEAHENLVEVSAENFPRFKDVLTFLREDIEKARKECGAE